jgi:predicted ferric reductase
MSGILKRSFVLFVIIFSVTLLSFPQQNVQAALQDSDADGLTDQAERDIYLTNSLQADTDGDNRGDAEEILSGTNPLQAEPPSLALANEKGVSSIAWYIGRASGILAFILLTLVVVNGLLMTTRLVFRLLPPALNYEMHRFFAWMAFFAVIGHFASFTFDQYFRLSLFEGLVPFAIMRDFPSRLGFDLRWAIGIGTIAFYGIAALLISSELKGRFLSLKKWRALHYSSFLTYLMFLGHGFFAGTDSREWWMLWLYGISATLVFSLTGLRIYAAIQKKKRSSASLSVPESTSLHNEAS